MFQRLVKTHNFVPISRAKQDLRRTIGRINCKTVRGVAHWAFHPKMDNIIYLSDQVVLPQGHCRILYRVVVVVVLLNSQSATHLQLFIKLHDGEGPLFFGIRTLAVYLTFLDDCEEFAIQ